MNWTIHNELDHNELVATMGTAAAWLSAIAVVKTGACGSPLRAVFSGPEIQ